MWAGAGRRAAVIGANNAGAARGVSRPLSGGGGLFPYDLGASYLVKPDLAHVKGPPAPALIELTVDGMFRRSVQQHPQRSAAIVCDGPDCVDAEHTYESLDAKVDDLARGLGRLGIRAGDRVGVWMPNNEEWLLVQLATSRIGALLTCINPAYRVRELVHALNLAQVRALVLVPSVASSNYVEMLDGLVGAQLSGRTAATSRAPLKCPELPHLEHLVLAESCAAVRAGKLSEESAARFVLFSTLLEKHGSVPGDGGLTPEQGINIQFTSGTTGRPKATLLSSRTIVNNGFLVARGQGLGPNARINVSVPLYHCFGLVMSNLAAFTVGGSVVYPSRVFSAQKALDVAARFKCTSQQGVPTMFAAMLDEFRARPRELALRTGIMAGAACPPSLMRQVAEHLGLKDLVICYGMTETGPVSFMTRVSDEDVDIRCTTVGRVMPNTECRVARDDGSVAAVGEAGELQTKGYLCMVGYDGNPAATEEIMTPCGFLKTGDVAVIDAAGYARIVGRMKDTVKRAGENLFPREVEECILELPAVAGVQVVGVPDPKYGEELCAVAIFKATAPAGGEERTKLVRDYVKGQLSHQKVPRYVLSVDSLDPWLTVTGKVQKHKLAEFASDKLGLRPPGAAAS